MNLEELIKRPARHTDVRGWVYEVLRPEDVTKERFAQIFVTGALPEKTKGNHYHRRKTEWFSVVHGKGEMTLTNVDTGEISTVMMSADEPLVLKVIPGLAHALKNVDDVPLIAIVYVDEPFNPNDTDTFDHAAR
ncbi:MAG: hypothetical protein QME66_09610 [Candidatus Eisenbacteria bacterium]|nr:hypothetical protein [Candidatus Eisenbacteria bacterium]